LQKASNSTAVSQPAPTVYRTNYLMALKALSRNGIAGAVVRTLDFAQRYTAAVDFTSLRLGALHPGANARLRRS